MNLPNIIHKVVMLSAYFFISIVWLMIFIFLGEDVDLNTIQDYTLYGQFTAVYLLIPLMHFLFCKSRLINTVMILIGTLMLPVIVAGFFGAINLSENIGLLGQARLITLIGFIVVYGLGSVKTYKNEGFN